MKPSSFDVAIARVDLAILAGDPESVADELQALLEEHGMLRLAARLIQIARTTVLPPGYLALLRKTVADGLTPDEPS